MNPLQALHHPKLEHDFHEELVGAHNGPDEPKHPDGEECRPVDLGDPLRAQEGGVPAQGGEQDWPEVEPGLQEVPGADADVEEDDVEGAPPLVVPVEVDAAGFIHGSAQEKVETRQSTCTVQGFVSDC